MHESEVGGYERTEFFATTLPGFTPIAGAKPDTGLVFIQLVRVQSIAVRVQKTLSGKLLLVIIFKGQQRRFCADRALATIDCL